MLPALRLAPGLVPDRQIRGFLFCISASGRVSKIWPICAQNVQEGLGSVTHTGPGAEASQRLALPFLQ